MEQDALKCKTRGENKNSRFYCDPIGGAMATERETRFVAIGARGGTSLESRERDWLCPVRRLTRRYTNDSLPAQLCLRENTFLLRAGVRLFRVTLQSGDQSPARSNYGSCLVRRDTIVRYIGTS